jgi:outer membrane protein OmpA-like peptidoglycan-associated protein
MPNAHLPRPQRMPVKTHRVLGPTVTVVGAGVAGLSAAHELIERGFRVQVVEAAQRPEAPGEAAVGGMARTQYGRVPVALAPHFSRKTRAPMLTTAAPFVLTQSLRFAPDEATSPHLEHVITAVVADLLALAGQVKSGLVPRFIDGLEVLGHADADENRRFALGQARADAVAEALRAALEASADELLQALTVTATSAGDLLPVAPSATAAARAANARVDFQVADHLLPGEHGYRFFPSFYRHIFDTMQRTPLLDANGRETGKTAFDNLVATSTQALSLDDDRRAPADFSRRKFKSFEEFREQLTNLKAQLGFRYADVAQYYLKMLRYVTTSPARRTAEYEKLSWWEFLEQGPAGSKLLYTPKFAAAAKAAPQALVAMKAEVADARTQGTITVQLTLDQGTDGTHTDCTLNGPTTEAWLLPWRRYLIRQGVQFFVGELQNLQPSAHGVTAHFAQVPVASTGDTDVAHCVFDADPAYFLLALDPQALQRVTAPLQPAVDADSDIAKLAALNLAAPVTPKDADYDQLLQHFAGVQFYFANDIKFVNGHVYFPDSEWGLSAISQLQFWQHRRNADDGLLGQLSVDIGNCLAKSRHLGKSVLQCSPDEIAQECWRQIQRSLQGPGRAHDGGEDEWVALPDPVYYHVDDNLVFKRTAAGKAKLQHNHTPFLINIAGSWAARPGDPHGYQVALSQVVMAGNAMRTWTRMSTMEASNESARHAVNAILRHLHAHGPAKDHRGRTRKFALVAGDLCATWNPEDHEVADLLPLRRLDEKLLKEGLPHLFDLLNLDALPQFYQHLPEGRNLDELGDAIHSAIFKAFPELGKHQAKWLEVKATLVKNSEVWRAQQVKSAESLAGLSGVVLKTLEEIAKL